jgi:Rrf2 family protein
MKISAATGYALQSLIRLARWDQSLPMSASRIARSDIPRRFLAHVLHRLVEHGLLSSTPGVAGGYHLARSPQTITLLAIIEAVEGTFSITMVRVPGLSTDAQNVLTSKFADASGQVRERLNTITLAQLASAGPNENDRLNQNGDSLCASENHNQETTTQLECLQQTAGSLP